MAFDHPQEGEAFLSTMPAGRNQRRHALVVVIVAAVLFVIVAPFARVPLPPAWAFVSIYDSALLVINLITAVLLFEQFSILRSRALLVLATGYLYAALMAVPHTLAFPGIFAPAGLLGDDPQTAAWIFVLWRVGWELTLVAYVFLRRNEPVSQKWSARSAIGLSAAMVLASTCLVTLLATQISHVLPELQHDGRYTRTVVIIAVAAFSLGVLVLFVFWRRRPKSVLDLWLMVVMFLTLLSAPLSSIMNTGRFDFGFYAGRIFGLVAASFVLINLLIEYGRLYAKLAAGQAELRRLTTIDPLTGIANRRAFDQAIDTEWRRAARNRTSLSLLLLDVDCFKSFNDVYGHPAGDDCLRTIATVLTRTARRGGETIARCGGEEFAVLLPGIDRVDACALARKLCQSVRDLGIQHSASTVSGNVTISIGVATARPAREHAGPGRPVEEADQALYAAKAAGRDRVVEYATMKIPAYGSVWN
jgi:diguanylate cyclase (GGDEF)-like protein